MNRQEKRQRARNFSAEEKAVLLELVYENRDVIENKKTDAATNKEKQMCWENITDKFNSQAPGCVRRSTTSLVKFYSNKKKDVRHEAAKRNMSCKEREGGPLDIKTEDQIFEIALASMNKCSVVGLNAAYGGDSDQYANEEQHILEDSICAGPSSSYNSGEPANAVETTEFTCAKNTTSDARKSNDQCDAEGQKDEAENNTDWGFFKASNLKKPKSIKFQTSNIARRRPLPKTGHLSETYEELGKKKLELVKQQIAAQLRDEERKEAEFVLRQDALKIDLEIKKEYLLKLKKCTTLPEGNFFGN